MKKKLLVFSLVAALVFVLCSCSQTDKTLGIDSQTKITSQEPDKTQPILAETAGDTAKTLFENLDLIDRLGGGAVECDSEQSVQVNGKTYIRVTDSRYSSVADITSLVKNSLTEKLIADRYSALTEGDSARYIDYNGALYAEDSARGCGFAFNGNITVTDIKEDSFTATQGFDNYGETDTLKITVVLTDGKWLIDSFEIAA